MVEEQWPRLAFVRLERGTGQAGGNGGTTQTHHHAQTPFRERGWAELDQSPVQTMHVVIAFREVFSRPHVGLPVTHGRLSLGAPATDIYQGGVLVRSPPLSDPLALIQSKDTRHAY